MDLRHFLKTFSVIPSLLFAGTLLAPKILLAAACCGGGFAFPSLILNDDKAQMTTSYGLQQIAADATSDDKWIRRADNNRTQQLKVDAATILPYNLQLGLSLTSSYKTNDNDSPSLNLGDTQLFLGHETFPELYYSKWKPHGITFIQVTLPTGNSIYEESQFTKLDGKGFYSLATGLALVKNYRTYDFNFNADIHYSFSRRFSQDEQSLTVKPGWGSAQTIGFGYNIKDLRLGTYLTHNFEDKITTIQQTSAKSDIQKVFTLGLVMNYLLAPEHAFTLNYSDQNLIGSPQNSALSRALILSYQHRWLR